MKNLLTEQLKICLLRNFTGNEDLFLADVDRHAWILDDRDNSIDLSDKCWYQGAGKQALEQHLAGRLFGTLLSSLKGDGDERWLPSRFAFPTEIRTPEGSQEWPSELPASEPRYQCQWDETKYEEYDPLPENMYFANIDTPEEDKPRAGFLSTPGEESPIRNDQNGEW